MSTCSTTWARWWPSPSAPGSSPPEAFGKAAPSCAGRGRDREFYKSFPTCLEEIACEKGLSPDKIEIWFKMKPASARRTRSRDVGRNAARGLARPRINEPLQPISSAPPQGRQGRWPLLPVCDTFAMNLHLAEIAKNVAPGAHALLLVDQAGWHVTDKLAVPANITIMPLPPKCPELNPTENVWQFIRDNWLSNRVFKSCDRRHRRSLLRCMEQTRRATMAHHVHRIAKLGAWVLISEGWYYTQMSRLGPPNPASMAGLGPPWTSISAN